MLWWISLLEGKWLVSCKVCGYRYRGAGLFVGEEGEGVDEEKEVERVVVDIWKGEK